MRARVAGQQIVTGGLGGLGLRTSAMLSRAGASSILVCSRSGLVSRGAPLTSLPRVASVVRSDVSCADDAVHLVRRALGSAGRLRGVWHAAGVLADVLVRNMSADHVGRAFGAKALGAWHLHSNDGRAPLDAFLLFSSIASVVGNVGQANYAGANSYLDALATSRRVHGLTACSLQIPIVRGAGMGEDAFGEGSGTEHLEVHLGVFVQWLAVAGLAWRPRTTAAALLLPATGAKTLLAAKAKSAKCRHPAADALRYG